MMDMIRFAAQKSVLYVGPASALKRILCGTVLQIGIERNRLVAPLNTHLFVSLGA